jgi:phosphoglycolate phosphatase
MLPPFEAILFDYDGTLAILNLDFAAMRQQLFAFTVAQGVAPQELHGLDILEMLTWATAWLRQHAPERAARYAREAEQLIQDIEVEAAHRSGLLPGVPEFLVVLQQEHIGIGIVTRNCDAAVRVTFPHIDTYCQAFMPRHRVTQVKPHPAHLQAALDCLGTTPARALMVGDGAMDMQAGKALGMFSIGVLSGNTPGAALLEHGADLVLASVTDLLPYIDRQSQAL